MPRRGDGEAAAVKGMRSMVWPDLVCDEQVPLSALSRLAREVEAAFRAAPFEYAGVQLCFTLAFGSGVVVGDWGTGVQTRSRELQRDA